MDRTSSTNRSASNEVSSDERFDKANRPGKARVPSGTPPGTTEKHPAANSHTPSLNVKQPSSSASALSPFVEDEDAAPQLGTANWRSQLDFSEIPGEFIAVFEMLREVEDDVSSKHADLTDLPKTKAELKAAKKSFKQQVAPGKSHEASDEYRLLRGNRTENSAMEAKLPKDSAFRGLLYPPTGGLRDMTTGLHAELRKRVIGGQPTYVLCFTGTGIAGNMGTQWMVNAQQALGTGGMPQLYHQALSLAAELRASLAAEGVELRVAGHSMGGGLANFIGLALNVESYCFNGAALGKASLKYLTVNGCMTAERIGRQNHLVLEGDFASASGLTSAIKVVSRSKQGPTLVGKVYRVPSDHEDYPQATNPVARHPLSAMENMMDNKKFELRQKARQTAAKATGTTTSAPATSKSPLGPGPSAMAPAPGHDSLATEEGGSTGDDASES